MPERTTRTAAAKYMAVSFDLCPLPGLPRIEQQHRAVDTSGKSGAHRHHRKNRSPHRETGRGFFIAMLTDGSFNLSKQFRRIFDNLLTVKKALTRRANQWHSAIFAEIVGKVRY